MVVVVFVVIVFVVVVSFWTRRKTEKEMEENIWRRKINGDANQLTDQGTGQIKCNLPFEGWKIEGRYLQMLSDNTPATAL